MLTGPDHGCDDGHDAGRIGQQGAALAPVHQPADGTLEVQIDQVETLFLDHTGGLGHDSRVGAADLAGTRFFLRGVGQQTQSTPVAPGHVAASMRSVQTRLAPCRFISSRKGGLVCSSIGASTTG